MGHMTSPISPNVPFEEAAVITLGLSRLYINIFYLQNLKAPATEAAELTPVRRYVCTA